MEYFFSYGYFYIPNSIILFFILYFYIILYYI